MVLQAEDLTIKGRVVDRITSQPLDQVDVELVGTFIKTKTDRHGRFEIRTVFLESYTIRYSRSGYETRFQRVETDSSVEIQLSVIELVPGPARIHERVLVYGIAEAGGTDSPYQPRIVTSEDIFRTPGAAEDLGRALSLSPVAARKSELSNDLIVRGGSPWENGFFVDNIQIPDLNHFQRQNSGGGLISIFDSSLINRISFFTGGFPASYGDKMSSIVKLTMRDGRQDRMSARLHLNTAGFGGLIEGPVIKEKASLILSFRRNYHDVLAKLIGHGVAPRFGDLYLRLHYAINPRNRITFLSINGSSRLSYDLETAVARGYNSFLNLKSRQNTAGLNWLSAWGSDSYLNTSLSISSYGLRHSITRVNQDSEYNSLNDGFQRLSFRSVLFHRLNRVSRLEMGIEINSEKARFDEFQVGHVNSWEIFVPEIRRDGRLGTSSSAAFFSYSWRPGNGLEAVAGLRGDYSSWNNRLNFSPRLSASWKISRQLKISGATGLYYQTLPLFLHFGNPENEINNNPSARHLVFGLDYDMASDTGLSLDIYRKSYRRLPLSSEVPTLCVMDSYLGYGRFVPFGPLEDTGRGVSEGVEILFQKREKRSLYGSVCLSLSRFRFRDLQGVWRARAFDNRVRFYFTGGYRPNNRWSASLRFDYAGGVPYMPFDIERSKEVNGGVLDMDRTGTVRYPYFQSLTLRIDRVFHFSRSRLEVYLSLSNILNRKNVESYYWNKIDNDLGVIYQTPILPLFGAVFTF